MNLRLLAALLGSVRLLCESFSSNLPQLHGLKRYSNLTDVGTEVRTVYTRDTKELSILNIYSSVLSSILEVPRNSSNIPYYLLI